MLLSEKIHLKQEQAVAGTLLNKNKEWYWKCTNISDKWGENRISVMTEYCQ